MEDVVVMLFGWIEREACWSIKRVSRLYIGINESLSVSGGREATRDKSEFVTGALRVEFLSTSIYRYDHLGRTRTY
jgi:hypothetical protein